MNNQVYFLRYLDTALIALDEIREIAWVEEEKATMLLLKRPSPLGETFYKTNWTLDKIIEVNGL